MDLNYFELFVDLRDWLVDKNPTLTSDITSSVKSYFSDKYQNHTVLPNDNSSEYLLDVMVTSFTPLNILDNTGNTIVVPDTPIINYIAVESELGGTGGSSAYGVQKNVVEDYVKLLLVN